jgi:peptidoglycan hydrolase-like protein with peptidoglycan-binding domain
MNGTLSIGDTGPEVEKWQRYLVSQGYRVATDGRFGPSTLAATRSMQRKLGVTPDGRVGHRTMDRQAATSAVPLPTARPDMPPAPQPGGMANTPTTGDQPFVSSGPEADLNLMHSAASNRAATDAMAQELQGQYYDARSADAASQGAPPAYRPDFTDQGNPPTAQALMQARGIKPNFDAAGPGMGAGASVDFGGVGGGGVTSGSPATLSSDPVKRDALIRALLQGVGG